MGYHSKGRCVDLLTLAYTRAALSITEDIAVMLLPIPGMLGLNLNNRKKLAVLSMCELSSLYEIRSFA